MTLIVGIDLSLAGTGLAVLDTRSTELMTTRRLPTKKSSDSIVDLLERMRHIRTCCSELTYGADLVVVEEQSYASTGSAARAIAGVWYLVVDQLLSDGLSFAMVPPSTLKLYATGKGNTKKREVSLAVARMWPDVVTASDDTDDAIVLASMGADFLGLALPYERTAYRERAMVKLRGGVA